MKKIYMVCLAVAVFMLFLMSYYANSEKEKIAKAVLRLHIVAESNSDADQNLKLKVRDAIISGTKEIFAKAENKEEAILLAEENKDLLLNIALKEIEKEGYSYPVTVSVEKTRFPLKVYDNIRLPSGIYDAINIRIGEAKGENWWCVMYPMLCFTDSITGKIESDGEKALKEELGNERFSLITDTSDKKINIKFKILEFF